MCSHDDITFCLHETNELSWVVQSEPVSKQAKLHRELSKRPKLFNNFKNTLDIFYT